MSEQKVQNMKQVLDSLKKKTEGKRLIRYMEDQEVMEISSRHFFEQVQEEALLLEAQGLAGKQVGIIGRNSWRWLVSFCGIFQAGAVAVLLDRELDPKMIGKLAERVELAAICYDDSAEEKIRAAGLSETVKRIPMGEKTEKIRKCSPPVEQKGEDLACIFFTSGTTAESKAVMLSQQGLAASICSTVNDKPFQALLGVLPFHHLSGFITVLNAMYLGAEVCLGTDLKYFYRYLEAIKAGISVPVSISHCELNESGQSVISYSHSVLLLDILGVNENYYEVKVCDPTETKYTTMRIYRQPGIEPKAFKIEYTPSDTYHYNVLRCYYSSLEEMDWRNYFGLDDNAGWLTDYNQNILVVRLDSSVSFTSDNVTLQYKDGVILNRENISSPYIIPNTMVDGTDASEAEFLFEKSSKDSVSSLSVSSETGYVDTTLILDGWSATIRSENAISVQANSQNQSVAIQSEDAGMISLLLTQNETAEDWPWYGIAVDVDDATELIVTPTDAGIQISSDNLDGAAVAGQSNDNIDSLTLNTKSKTVLLVNKTPSDSGSNYIGIIAEDVTVTFDPNGGTVTPVSAVTGEDGTLASLPVPTRDGYIFNGWYSAPSGGNKITTSTVFATNTTVYAQWSKDTSGSSSSGSGSSTANTYTISTSATENGSVSVSPKSASEGSTVTITAAPDTGYRLDKLTVTDKHGNEVSLIDNGNGTYTFTMPASQVSISASFIALEVPAPALPFTDVTTSDWFYDAVAYAYDNGLMTGTSATTFSPKATTTRGMIVTILHRLEGCPAAAASGFADVKSGAWYQEAVDWAAANGIVNGTSATTFAPTSPITREQMAAILYRYAAYKGYDVSQLANLSRFSDSSAVSAYAADALAWANAAGLITGVTDISLSPQGSAVRAQVATILMRFCENIAQ